MSCTAAPPYPIKSQQAQGGTYGTAALPLLAHSSRGYEVVQDGARLREHLTREGEEAEEVHQLGHELLLSHIDAAKEAQLNQKTRSCSPRLVRLRPISSS